MKLLNTLAVVAVVAALGGVAVADDVNPAPWDLSLPNQTYLVWEAAMGTGMPFFENPYGEPWIEFIGPWTPEEIPGPHDPNQPIPTLHCGEPGGTIDIWIPNNPDPLMVKKIFWQVTADKAIGSATNPPSTNPPGTNQPAPYPHTQWPVDNWYTYNGLIEIRPNPDGEMISFPIIPSTNVSQIVIKTICVPEPATVSILGLGVLALLRRRRR